VSLVVLRIFFRQTVVFEEVSTRLVCRVTCCQFFVAQTIRLLQLEALRVPVPERFPLAFTPSLTLILDFVVCLLVSNTLESDE